AWNSPIIPGSRCSGADPTERRPLQSDFWRLLNAIHAQDLFLRDPARQRRAADVERWIVTSRRAPADGLFAGRFAARPDHGAAPEDPPAAAAAGPGHTARLGASDRAEIRSGRVDSAADRAVTGPDCHRGLPGCARVRRNRSAGAAADARGAR